MEDYTESRKRRGGNVAARLESFPKLLLSECVENKPK